LIEPRMSDGRVSEHHPFLVIFRASPAMWSTAVTPSQAVGAAGRGHERGPIPFSRLDALSA
jgi:hypothetical protein